MIYGILTHERCLASLLAWQRGKFDSLEDTIGDEWGRNDIEEGGEGGRPVGMAV